MLRNTLLIISILSIALLFGCSQGTTETPTNTNAARTTAATPAPTAATTAPVAAEEKIGVPECDDFIAKYDACVSSKVPEAARAQYKTAVSEWRKSWKKLAENAATKGSLATACKTAAEQQAAALKSYGCTW